VTNETKLKGMMERSGRRNEAYAYIEEKWDWAKP
jgi:hypothetical protein